MGQVIEVPRDENTFFGIDFAADFGQLADRTHVGFGLRAHGVFHLLHRMVGAVEILLPVRDLVVTHTLYGDFVRFEARVLDSLGVPQFTQEELREREEYDALHSPGEQEKQEGIHEVLLDLARSGKKDDFMWMAQYEANLDPVVDDLPGFWAKTRRLLHLPEEVEA